MESVNKKEAGSPRTRLSQILPILLPIALSILVYLNTLPNGFVFDDMQTIVHNEYIGDLSKNFSAFFNLDYFKIAKTEASYRPIATLSYFVIYALFGLNPLAFHLSSLLLHIFNVVSVYILVSLIQKDKKTACIAALIFACHPVLTEVVNCISYNEDLLATLFCLIALILYIKTTATEKTSGLIFYVLSLVLFLAALLSKEMAITLPAIIILYDLTSGRESAETDGFVKQAVTTVKNHKYYYLGFILVGLFYLVLRFKILVNPTGAFFHSRATLFERIIFLPDQLFSYIQLALAPLNLNAEYSFAYPDSFFDFSNIFSFLVIIGIVVGSLFIYKHSRGIFLGIWWFIITLLPVLNLIEIHNPIAERYLYFPLVGFCLVVSILINEVMAKSNLSKSKNWKLIKYSLLIGLLIFYSLATIARNPVWKDNFSVWANTVEKSPNNSIVHGGLGLAYQQRGFLDEAIRELKKAVELSPKMDKNHYNLGRVYEEKGLFENAIGSYKRAIELNPGYINAYFNVANIYMRIGLRQDAIYAYQKVIELNPKDLEAHNNLGVAYAMQGQIDRAISQWEKALEVDPQNQNAKDNISKAKRLKDQ